ncbi:hypothetical protein [Nocardiopsis kunsanensis]|uniref:hypothetical protein n=1 Tax=Nocardiopsis kunsanensis TaxID=141693 RepID=UPI00034D731C|nr:hypothetical protein [Nocardiopsis kunsanensis]
MDHERQERDDTHPRPRGRQGGTSPEGLATAMTRPETGGLPHWGGRRPPRTIPVDVADGPLPGRLPEKGRE